MCQDVMLKFKGDGPIEIVQELPPQIEATVRVVTLMMQDKMAHKAFVIIPSKGRKRG